MLKLDEPPARFSVAENVLLETLPVNETGFPRASVVLNTVILKFITGSMDEVTSRANCPPEYTTESICS